MLIINEAMARLYWPGENVVGRRVTFEDHPKERDWLTIVGVVGDVKDSPASDGAAPAFWWTLREFPYLDMVIAVRGRSGTAGLADDIREAVHSLDPSIAVAEIRTMDEISARAYSASQFALFLFGLFALLALSLAGIGTYGVMSYSINQRSNEFGLRMALGAQSTDVLVSVLKQGMKLTLAGAAVGVVCSLLFGKILASLLYRVSAYDPLTMAAACLVVLTTAALARYVPARRATQSDPMEACEPIDLASIMGFRLRVATEEDVPAIAALISDSVRGLQAEDYSAQEIEGALATVFTVDSQLIADGTYFVAEYNDGTLAGCGGWSFRKTLYGGDAQLEDVRPERLDPTIDAAKVRAIFVSPQHARKGLGTLLLQEAEEAASQAGFSRFEMGSTLTGLRLYTLKGYREIERVLAPVGGGHSIEVVRMEKSAATFAP